MEREMKLKRGIPIVKRINGKDYLTLLTKHSGEETTDNYAFDEILMIIDLYECGRKKELTEYLKRIN